jgi:hypothetical protein
LPALPQEVHCLPPAPIAFDKAVNGVMPQEEAFRSWARDRARASSCYRKNEALISMYEELRTGERPEPSAQ